jgi:hypothetical protein
MSNRARHRKPTRGGFGVAAIATSGAFALVPMVMSTTAANASTAEAIPPAPVMLGDHAFPSVPAPRHAAPQESLGPAAAPAVGRHALAGPRHAAPAANDAAAPVPAQTTAYTVRPGDTLSGIGASRGMDWQSIWASNKAAVPKPDLLHPGEQLQLPTAAAPAPTAAPAAAPLPGTAPFAAPAPAAQPAPAIVPPRAAAPAPAVRPAPAAKPAQTAKPMREATSTASGAAKTVTGAGKKITAAAKPGNAIDVTPTGPTKQMKIWLTGYSFQDNTPAGSATVSHPILHKDAGGTGTYADPITVAVPGQGSGIFKAGSRFYLPTVKRYVIVEDTGASAPPSGQDGHLDMWIGGQGGTKSATDACMDKITGTNVPAVFNPTTTMPVTKGPVFGNGTCNVSSKA